MPLRAFPVVYAADVESVAAFYIQLGFVEFFRLPTPEGELGYIALRRDTAELAITTEDAPRQLWGLEPGPGPRHELFVYVDDLDATIARLHGAGARIIREPAEMPWGERVAAVADPEGNVVSLALAG